MKLDKDNERPWLKFYINDRVKSNLDYPKGSLYDEILKTSKKYPNKIAYYYMDTEVTYKDFIEKINNCAKALKSCGTENGDIITICMPNTPEGIIMFYAVNMVGAIASMIHPLSGEKEIEKYLKESQSKIILTIDQAYDKVLNVLASTHIEKIIVSTGADSLPTFKNAFYNIVNGNFNPLKKIKQFFLKVLDNIDTTYFNKFISKGQKYNDDPYLHKEDYEPAIILYSGGSTGSPKGIILSNKNFNALAKQSYLMCDPASEKDSILTIMPIFHGFGLGVCVHCGLTNGMRLILVPKFEKDKLKDLIIKSKPTFLVGVPTFYETLLKQNFSKHDLKNIRCVISGGDILQKNQKNKIDLFLKEHGSKATIRVGYGLTETSGASCLTPTGLNKEETIGVPFPDTYYKIVKIGTHTTADINEDGEICISGPTVMLGYFNDIKETMQTLREHDDGKIWLHTKDIGCMDKDGIVYFKTRLKRMIVSNGYNIYPNYIEEVLNKHKAVLTSIVIGVADDYSGQHAKAYIILNNGYKPTEELKNSLYEHCKKNLAKYSIPKEFEFKEELPKTLIGKISYKDL